jgi:endonuclease/exonuclease/phosphatase family metal-dependent hydrolase
MRSYLYHISTSDIFLCVTTMLIAFNLSLPAAWAENINDITINGETVSQVNVGDNQGLKPTVLKILTLNLAHGRGTSLNQLLLSTGSITKNLDTIAKFLKKESPDIIALQEADAPSNWSGNFDHVEYLARKAGYPWLLHGKHAKNLFGHYGTAIISRFPIVRGLKLDFSPTPPTMTKGFTLAEVNVVNPEQPGEETLLDVISVHLDFSRKSKRMEQINELKGVLDKRKNPKIIMGDFNTSWNSGEELLQKVTDKKVLKTHLPESVDLNTYKDKRLDWIFISDCIKFKSYRTANGALSDHRAVIAEIVFSHKLNCGEEDG